ncbi:MAG: hydrogenase maturation protease [Varibaculum sp.]|nr:hydrogenase maturation protease [Varibaculum sp.]
MGKNTTVLAVGNPIMGDDGVGLEILAGLEKRWPETVGSEQLQFVDGGTGGMQLIPVVQDSERLLILDALQPGESTGGIEPGTALHIGGDQVPRLLSMKMSPHQVGLLDVLTSCRLLGTEPDKVEVVGVTVADVDLRVGLSDPVSAAVPAAIDLAESLLREWLG